MTRFNSVKLELLRPGPAHNQLLSQLTPYLALCGDGSPVTFRIEMDHHNLMNRLERLRYLTVQNHVREATVSEVGEEVADILSKIPTLLAEISRARSDAPAPDGADMQYVHLNLVLGGAELALIPFELAFSPQSFPGEGLEFCLQLDLPVVTTRETRRSRHMLTAWDSVREPKLLVVVADPQGFGVPLIEHLTALRAAMEPWIDWPRRVKDNTDAVTEKERLQFVKERIKVLSNASLEEIREKCAAEKFTNIHILAHGGEYKVAGETQFGIMLCADGNKNETDVVNGKRLAHALQAQASDGSTRSSPLAVTLATCDAGHEGSVLLPGGSIAHDLHTAGIPWVFASQFPLTKAGSIRLIEALYPGLLRGDDPRQLLHEVRRRLYMLNQRDHDWASLVVYASVPREFDEQVATFFERRSQAAIDIALKRGDDLADIDSDGARAEMDKKLGQVTDILQVWRTRLPGKEVKEPSASARRAHCYGMHGSVFKRIALLQYRQKKRETGDATLKDSLAYYRKAMEEDQSSWDKFHWVATQALALGAALHDAPDPTTFELTWHMAQRNLQNPAAEEQAWAQATLAELEMIRAHHRTRISTESESALEGVKREVLKHCREILKLMGPGSFQVESTRRQFKRYLEYWHDPQWDEIAKAAVELLGGSAG